MPLDPKYAGELAELVWLVRRVLERAERAPWEDAGIRGRDQVKRVYLSRGWVELAQAIIYQKTGRK